MAEKKLKGHIVSFRIPKEEAETVAKMIKDRPIIGIKSVSQWFRKIGLDCVSGKVVYKNSQDMVISD